MDMLRRSFFERPADVVARDLLGCFLFHQTAEGTAGGRIVETEAYLGDQDPAAHAYRGMTPRNAALFGPPGTAYVYFIYGMHHCLNAVVGGGHGILLRALEPTEGIELMRRRRNLEKLTDLCRGPARLVEALGVRPDQNGIPLTELPLFMAFGTPPPTPVGTSERIGIQKAADRQLRFYETENSFVSGIKNRRVKNS